MSHRKFGHRKLRQNLLMASSFLVLSLVCIASGKAHADVPSTNWTGNGADPTLWSDSNNWDNGVPTTSVPAFFNISANVVVDSSLQAGNVTINSNSTVDLQPNSVLNDDMVVGDTAGGSFNNTSAVHNVTGNLILGNQGGSNGNYSVTGDTAITSIGFAGNPGDVNVETPNGALIVGNSGTGNFTQGTDATDANNQVNVAGDVVIGLNSGSGGTYILNSGTLTVGGQMLVGEGGTSANVFTQNGGTVTINGSASSDSRYTASVTPDSGSLFGDLYVGGEKLFDNAVGIYNLLGGSLTAQSLYLGWSGTGTLNQSGGSVNVGYIELGDCGGCNGGNAAGFYNLTGNGSLTTGDFNVGGDGHGEVVQNGADSLVTVNGTLSLGNGPYPTPDVANSGNYDRSGTYTLKAGTLDTSATVVGSQGKGTFVQSGGLHAVSTTLTVGQTNQQPLSTPNNPGDPIFGGPAPGLYTMTGGTLTVGGQTASSTANFNIGILIGDAGNGTFNQSGGTVTSGIAGVQRGDLVIGGQAGSIGTYNLTDPSNSGNVGLTVNGNTVIGRDTMTTETVAVGTGGQTAIIPLAAANGSLTIGNGSDSPIFTTVATSDANGDVTVGDAGVGAFTVNSGSALIAGNINVGVNGTGTVTQTGGSVTANFVDLSTAAGIGSSSYTMTGGKLTTLADLNVGGGSSGSSTFTESGTLTTATIGGALRVGNANNTASASLSSGTLNVTRDSFVGFQNLVGTMTQSGGTFNTQTLTVGDRAGGTFTQSGGTTAVTGAMTIGTVGTATLTSLSAGTITNNNKLVLANANVTAPTVTNNALMEGTGTVTGNVINNGTFHPGGDLPGILNIAGNYTQSSTGIMDFTLNGNTPGTGYSQADITGSASLNGILNITDKSFTPNASETFALIDAGLVSGSFSSLSFDNNACTLSGGVYACSGDGKMVDFKEIVSGNSVELMVASISSVPLPSSLVLFGTAMLGLAGFTAKRRREGGIK